MTADDAQRLQTQLDIVKHMTWDVSLAPQWVTDPDTGDSYCETPIGSVPYDSLPSEVLELLAAVPVLLKENAALTEALEVTGE
jgi:hypothetical protein